MLTTCTALAVGTFERICYFNEAFLMAPTSTKQVFIERPLFPVTSVKKFICNVIGFTIFHLSEAATGGVLLEKVFLVLRNFAKFIGKRLWQSLFFSKVAG